MKSRSYLIFFIYFIPDVLAILLSLVVSTLFAVSHFVIPGSKLTFFDVHAEYIFIAASVVWYYSSKSTGLYNDPISKEIGQDVSNIFKNIAIQLVCLVIGFFVVKEHVLTRIFIVAYGFMLVVTLLTDKYLVRVLILYLKKKTQTLGNVLIVGGGSLVNEVRENFSSSSFGYNIVGVIQDDGERKPGIDDAGSFQNLEQIVRDKAVDIVVIAYPQANREKLNYIINVCQKYFVTVKIIPELSEYYSRHFTYTFVGAVPLISIPLDRLSETHWKIIKRAFDILLALIVTVTVLIWFFPIIIVLQKLFDRGPIFYKSERRGMGEKYFTIYKFRTMNRDSSHTTQYHRPTSKFDERITKFGRILRRTSLDELPQIINVLRGEMSAVGPRPLDTKESEVLKNLINNYMIRHYIKPGMTGWAQVNGYRGGTENVALMQKRFELDNWYIKNWTLGLDIQILLMTLRKILTGDTQAY
jgi:putative colanic acid biosynthesis UDP-glucose lipid carrier transferase